MPESSLNTGCSGGLGVMVRPNQHLTYLILRWGGFELSQLSQLSQTQD